jgi:hypothetical protein
MINYSQTTDGSAKKVRHTHKAKFMKHQCILPIVSPLIKGHRLVDFYLSLTSYAALAVTISLLKNNNFCTIILLWKRTTAMKRTTL